MTDVGAVLTLGRWLGPWAGTRVPTGPTRTSVESAGTPGKVSAYVYRPRGGARGAYLIAHGLHFAGPDDPRLDRFCRVLAQAGFVVVAPLLRDFLSLVIAESAWLDLASGLDRTLEIVRAESLPPPVLFSISFGSLPAIRLAASDRGRSIGRLCLFGGFCDFDATVRYAITGRAARAGKNLEVSHDPLNAPVVHLNLLPFYPPGLDRARLARAWRDMVVRTWGRPELKVGRAREPSALAVATEHGLDAELRHAFLVGCGLEPGGEALLEGALRSAGDAYAWADPRPHLARVRAPVAIVHGMGDDVIPFFEAEKLRAALPEGHPHELYLTGMYGHTGSALPRPGRALAEGATLVRVLGLLARPTRLRPTRATPRGGHSTDHASGQRGDHRRRRDVEKCGVAHLARDVLGSAPRRLSCRHR